MKTKTYLISGGIALLLAIFFLGRWTAPNSTNPHAGHNQVATAPSAQQIWSCSMHPQIQATEAGNCPICGMKLIPIGQGPGSEDGPRSFSMSESAKALADIQTSPVEKQFPQAEIRLVGKLGYDETKEKSLTARFPARIDELFVNFTGIPVKQGDHLARVYSPELLTAQSELLSAFRYDPNSSTTLAAKEKLRLWDLLPEQIDSIIQSGKASDHFELKAPISGVVVHKNVNEGDYIKTGQPLFRIVDLSDLWLRLDAYESDLAWLRFGQQVSFSVEAYPGQTFQGRITFINPEIDPKSRTVSVRVNVPNEERKLKPGMFAKAVVRSNIALAGKVYSPEFAGKWISPMHPEIVKDAPGKCDICGMDLLPAEELGYVQDPNAEPPLVVPASAVLRTGKRAVVYVEIPDTDTPTYEGREIEIGARAGDVFIVSSGLIIEDRVVTNGAFKIDSALQIRAKPSMMNPQGGGPTPGHDHGDAAPTTGPSEHSDRILLEFDSAATKSILPHYFALQSALAADSMDGTKEALREMMAVTGHSGPAGDLVHTMLEADSLDGIRRPHFETLSNALIESVSNLDNAFEGSLFQMHCPMVYPDRGADWLQRDNQLKNPYFGAMMLTCGEVKGTWDEGRWTEGTSQ